MEFAENIPDAPNFSMRAGELLVDYSQMSQLFTLGSTDTSKRNRLAFWAPQEHQVCAVDLKTLRTYCADHNVTPEVDGASSITS